MVRLNLYKMLDVMLMKKGLCSCRKRRKSVRKRVTLIFGDFLKFLHHQGGCFQRVILLCISLLNRWVLHTSVYAISFMSIYSYIYVYVCVVNISVWFPYRCVETESPSHVSRARARELSFIFTKSLVFFNVRKNYLDFKFI